MSALKASVIPSSWLVERLPSDDYLAACRADLRAAGFDDAEIERLLAKLGEQTHDRWRQLLAEKKNGDELWRYRSPPDSWTALSGCAGFAVVRVGVPVATMNTLRS